MSQPSSTWLTRKAYDNLSEELARLQEVGDGGEADPAQAKDRQARITRLQDMLAGATVEEPPPDDGIAEPGMVLTVRYDDEDDTDTFLLGVRDGSSQEDLPVYSAHSPLGQAVTGACRGERRTYTTPRGTTINVTLVAAAPYGAHEVSHDA